MSKPTKAVRTLHLMTDGYAPYTGRLLAQLAQPAQRVDWSAEPDANGARPRVPTGYSMSVALGSQDIAILFVLAAVANSNPGDAFTVDELLPYCAVRTARTLTTKLQALERNGWVKSAKGRAPGDRQTYWAIDV